MAAQKGRDLLLKIRTSTGPDVFASLAGMRTNSMTMGEESVDVTNKDSNGYRDLLDGRIVQSMQISGEAVFQDDSSVALARTTFLAGTHEKFQLVLPGVSAGAAGTFEGLWRITQMEFAGDYNNEVTYNVTLESDGQIVFTDLP